MLQRQAINRIIDANFNRTKEGLRVCEEIVRFVLNNRSLSFSFKHIRHALDGAFCKSPIPKGVLLKSRDVRKDVGCSMQHVELQRKSIEDVFFANIQRVKESLRVLEEFTKITKPQSAFVFKKIRYGVYALEKKTAKKIASLRNP